jgi:hypothetical protein
MTVRSIHAGVDVVAPDGAPVFATVSGSAVVLPGKVYVRTNGGRMLEYWHIVPSVRDGMRVVAYSTLLGHVASGMGHVHVAESIRGLSLNPLRREGGMGPYVDRTTPVVENLAVLSGPSRLTMDRVEGVVDFVVEAYDPPALPLPRPFEDYLMTPASLRWRLSTLAGTSVVPWETVLNVTTAFPHLGHGRLDFGDVYARKTQQNEYHAGRYRFHLERGLDTRRLANGLYLVEVEAQDTGGNRVLLRTTLRILNRDVNEPEALVTMEEK